MNKKENQVNEGKKKLFVSVGCDISSEKIDVFLMNEEEKGIHRVFKNNSSGMEEIIKLLQINSFEGKIVMDSTGSYHELLAATLHLNNYDVYVINPLIVKKYTQASIQKCKTDKQDSKVLAEIGIKEKKMNNKFELTFKDLKIKKKINLIKSLEKKVQQLKSVVREYKSSQEKLGNDLSEEELSLMDLVKKIDKKRKDLEKEVISIVFPIRNKEAQKAKEVLTSIIGISQYYAALIYNSYSFDKSKNANSWIAYSGLAVSVAESGKWKGTGRISKRGHSYLGKRNFSSGWGGFMHNKYLEKYYYFLKQEKNRKHTEAIVIMGRKILRTAYHCLKYNVMFDENIMIKNIEDVIGDFVIKQ